MSATTDSLLEKVLGEVGQEILERPWADYVEVMSFATLDEELSRVIDSAIKLKVAALLASNPSVADREYAHEMLLLLIRWVSREERYRSATVRWQAFDDLVVLRVSGTIVG